MAERASVSQSKVSKFESGLAQMSDDDLVTIAGVLGFPLSFFSQPDRVYGFGSACFYHRKKQAMPVNDLRVIHAKLNIIRMHVTRFVRAVEIETDNKFCRMDVEEYKTPEEVVRSAGGMVSADGANPGFGWRDRKQRRHRLVNAIRNQSPGRGKPACGGSPPVISGECRRRRVIGCGLPSPTSWGTC